MGLQQDTMWLAKQLGLIDRHGVFRGYFQEYPLTLSDSQNILTLHNNNNLLLDTILKSYTLKLFLLLCISILSACGTQPITPYQESDGEADSATERQAILTEEARNLLELAENSDTETEQQDYRARAAHLFIKAGEIQADHIHPLHRHREHQADMPYLLPHQYTHNHKFL